MAEVTRADVLEYLEKSGLWEISQLIKDIEGKFGVTAVAPITLTAAAPGAASGDAGKSAEEEKTTFDVVLTSVGDKKIQVIKVVRTLTDIGLKEAKDLVDNAPRPVKEGVQKAQAEGMKKQLEEAGATVELK